MHARTHRPGPLWLLLLLCLAMTGTAQARDYRIEIVLFEHLEHQDGGTAQLFYPAITQALGLSSPQAADAGFALISDELTLTDAAQSIDDSPRYRPVATLCLASARPR